jgi:proline iminopeptidase
MSRTLYPKISPNHHLWLDVGDGHKLYVESSGNSKGIPVIYLHGGPGSGSSEHCRRYFDPEKYHIILFDQRGCGKSNPSPSIDNNTMQKLIADIELIRLHFSVTKWLICGGSWGTTLAIAYGIAHRDAVLGFVLRGVFLGSPPEYDWLYSSHGVAHFFPQYYRDFKSILPSQYMDKPLQGYHQLLTSDNELERVSASRSWYVWESRLSSIEHSIDALSHIDDPHQALCMAQISNHYFINGCFIGEKPLLDQIDQISDLPAIILHGRYDMICQLHYTDSLVQLWKNAQLQILPCAGHSGFERQTIDAFCKATDTMASFIQELDQ